MPAPAGPEWNDGGLLRYLNDENALPFLAAYVVHFRAGEDRLNDEGTRPWMERLIQLGPENENWAGSRLYGYDWAVGDGNLDLAERCLTDLTTRLDKVPEDTRASVLYEVAYFHARFHRRTEGPREWIERAAEYPECLPHKPLRAEAALLWARGDPAARAAASGAISLMDYEAADYEVDVPWLQSLAEGKAPAPTAL